MSGPIAADAGAWLVYLPETGLDAEPTQEAALQAAADAIEAAGDGEWPDWVENIVVARVTHRAMPKNQRPDPSGDCDFLVDWSMEPISDHLSDRPWTYCVDRQPEEPGRYEVALLIFARRVPPRLRLDHRDWSRGSVLV